MKAAQKLKDDYKTLVIERIFDAPRERVFKAWTDKGELMKWNGPSHHPAISFEGEFRVGGKWRSVLRSVETGRELPQHGVYKEIREPELLVFTFMWEEHDEENVETLVTIQFEDIDGDKTRMIFRQEPFLSLINRDGHNEGWNNAFERLQAVL